MVPSRMNSEYKILAMRTIKILFLSTYRKHTLILTFSILSKLELKLKKKEDIVCLGVEMLMANFHFF